MVTVYVIESLKDSTWYTGMALSAEVRLKEHNAAKNRFTKGHRPWKLIYTEQHPSGLKRDLAKNILKLMPVK